MKAIAFIALLMSGCACLPKLSSYDYCATARPVMISKSDVLTDETAKQILAGNKTWAKLCRK